MAKPASTQHLDWTQHSHRHYKRSERKKRQTRRRETATNQEAGQSMGILWTLFATLFVAVLGGVALSALGAWNEHQRIAAAKETERRMGPRRRVVGEFTTPSRKQAPALVNQQVVAQGAETKPFLSQSIQGEKRRVVYRDNIPAYSPSFHHASSHIIAEQSSVYVGGVPQEVQSTPLSAALDRTMLEIQQRREARSMSSRNISISSVSQLAPAISNKSRLRSSHLKQEVGGESERRSEDEPSVEDMVVEPGAEQEGDFVRDAIDIKRKVDQTQAAYQEFPHRTSTAASPTPGGKRRRPSQDTTLPQPSTPNEAALTKRLSKIRKATHADSSTPSTPQRAVSRIGTPATGTKRKQSAGATPGPQRGSGGISLFQDEDEYTPDEDAEDARVRRETGMRAEDGWVTPFSYRKRRRGENGVVMLGKEDMEPVASAPRARVAPGTTPRGRVRISSGTPLKEIVDRRAVVGSKMPMPLLYRGPNEEEVQRILRASLSSGVDEPAGKGDAMEKKSVKFADEGGGSLEAGPSPSLGAKSGGVIVAADVMPVKFVGFGDGVLATSTPVVGAVAESASAAEAKAGFNFPSRSAMGSSPDKGGLGFSAGAAEKANTAVSPVGLGGEQKDATPLVGGFSLPAATFATELAKTGGFSFGGVDGVSAAPVAVANTSTKTSFAGMGNQNDAHTVPSELSKTGGFSLGAPSSSSDSTKSGGLGGFSFGSTLSSSATSEPPKSVGGFSLPAPATSAAPVPASNPSKAASSSHPASPAGFSLLNANSATTSDSSKSSGGGFSFSAAPASAAPAVGSFGTTSNTTTPATGSSEVAASGGFSLGASTTPAPGASKPASSSGFSFGSTAAPSASVSAEAPKSAAGFSFGNATAITPSPAEAPQTGGFSFSATAPAGPVEDTPQTAAPFSFGTHTPAATEAPKSQGFGGFGSSSVTPAPAPATSAAPSAFSFGNTPSSSSSVPAFGQQPTAVTPAFGAPAATQPISGVAPPFGAPSSNMPQSAPAFGGFGSQVSAASPFGQAATTAAPAFGQAASVQSATNPTTTFSFGSQPATGTTPSGFGSQPSTAPAANAFGSTNSSSSGFGGFGASTSNSTPAASGSFGAFGATAATNTGTQPGTFGSQSSSATTGSFGAFGGAPTSTGGAFGSQPAGSASAPPFGASTSKAGFGGAFGSSTTPTTSSTPFAFGSGSAATPTTSGSSSFGFGSGGSAVTPAFGGSAPAFGANAPSASTSTFQFGANNNPVGSVPAFGQQAQAASSQPFAFGSSQPPPQQQPAFAFGAQPPPSSASFAFGGASGSGSSGGATFNMGASTTENKLERKLAQPKSRMQGRRMPAPGTRR